MTILKKIKGNKFADEYVYRFFYKNKLNEKNGRVIELGCGNGSNLQIFYQYGWDTYGVDISKALILEANYNFTNLKKEYFLKKTYKFMQEDMLNYAINYNDKPVDVLTLPSSVYYMEKSNIELLFKTINKNKIINEGSYFFIRWRSVNDYRFNKGTEISKNSFKLNISETGEKGCIVTFMGKEEMLNLVNTYFDFEKQPVFLKCTFDNIQNGKIVSNDDMIFWGKLA